MYDLNKIEDEYRAAEAVRGATQNFHFPRKVWDVLEECVLPEAEYARARRERARREARLHYGVATTAILNAYAWRFGLPTISLPARFLPKPPEALKHHLDDHYMYFNLKKELMNRLAQEMGLDDPEETPMHQVLYQMALYYGNLKGRVALWEAVGERLRLDPEEDA